MTASVQSNQPYHPWTTYIAAREEARRLGNARVGTDHLVLGLLRESEICSVLGVSLDAARDALVELDRRALGKLGIGLELNVPLLPERPLPPRPTVKAVLKDRLALTPAAKTALQDAGKPMRRGHRITPQQVLLALLENKSPDPVVLLFDALGIDSVLLRQRLVTSLAA